MNKRVGLTEAQFEMLNGMQESINVMANKFEGMLLITAAGAGLKLTKQPELGRDDKGPFMTVEVPDEPGDTELPQGSPTE